ncbi:MAG TPA: hypothetical protein VJZ27_13765, partial [Aggregatilineales bacterium]|nr:hypothetical protein [Aggregatilineales bacterium]
MGAIVFDAVEANSSQYDAAGVAILASIVTFIVVWVIELLIGHLLLRDYFEARQVEKEYQNMLQEQRQTAMKRADVDLFTTDFYLW